MILQLELCWCNQSNWIEVVVYFPLLYITSESLGLSLWEKVGSNLGIDYWLLIEASIVKSRALYLIT